MINQAIEYDAILRNAHMLRAQAFADFFRRMAAQLSPRMPKIFPAEF